MTLNSAKAMPVCRAIRKLVVSPPRGQGAQQQCRELHEQAYRRFPSFCRDYGTHRCLM